MADTSLAVLPKEDPSAELAATQIQTLSNTGSALAAHVQATVQARYIVAMQRPRDWAVVRQKMLAECRRLGFAEQARYKKPLGGGKFAEGESVRFAEAAARNMGNIVTEVIAVEENADVRVLRVVTTDIESNTTFSTDVSVKRSVERRFVKEGQTVLSQRRNSNGDIVYLVEATDDDLAVKAGSAISKATRNNILRLLPGDIVDDCLAECNRTIAGRGKEDPVAERNKLLDAFGFFGILPTQIGEYFGHDATQFSKAEMDELRLLYTAVKTGETTWPQIMATKAEALGKVGAPAAKDAADAVRGKLEKK